MDCGEMFLQPLIGICESAVVGIFIAVGSDVGVVRGPAVFDVLRQLRIRDALYILPGSGADVGKVDERIMAAIVGVGLAAFQTLITGIGQVFLVGLPCVAALQHFADYIVL